MPAYVHVLAPSPIPKRVADAVPSCLAIRYPGSRRDTFGERAASVQLFLSTWDSSIWTALPAAIRPVECLHRSRGVKDHGNDVPLSQFWTECGGAWWCE